ncbi:MAG: 2Fe-2S iron-sulfur cluster-binding protein, partial [Calditrichia bacterium]
MPLVKIDGQEGTVENGTLVLEAAKQLGIEIPHYCYHPALAVVASCRMCLVKIEGFPKLVPSCQTRIGEMPPERKVDGKYDMVVTTRSDEVKDAQESILEFLLLNHPVDCPECDQAGECLLQDYSYKYGKDKSRFEFAKRVPPRKDLGPNMLLIATRCILCSRCIRFTEEITGTNELMVKNRGARSEIDLFPGQSLDNKLSMCTADVCPVGALVTKDFLYKPRTWRYRKTQTVCPGCPVGCNIEIDYMEEDNNIYRINPMYNQQVNEWWMCDEGRLLYHSYKKLNRLQYPLVKSGGELQRTNWKTALKMV